MLLPEISINDPKSFSWR